MPPRPGRSEQGSSTVELVLLTPVLMVAVFLIIQTALYVHARHVLLAAAQQGARLARSSTVTDPNATRTATLAYVRQLGPQLVTAPTVTVQRTEELATVTVTGNAPSILPGLQLRIVEHATGPIERFRPDLVP